jgi:hypothetical protein
MTPPVGAWLAQPLLLQRSLLSSQPVTPDDAREAARRLLEEGEFTPAPSANRSRPLQQPLTWLGEQIQKVFEPIGRLLANTVGRGGPIGWVMFALCLIAGVTFLVRSWSKRVRAKQNDGDEDEQLEQRIEELESLAAAAAAAGRWGEATRLKFRIGLLKFELGGRITKVDRKPNREVTELLPAPTLAGIVSIHDSLAYGRAQGDESTYGDMVSGLTKAEHELDTKAASVESGPR